MTGLGPLKVLRIAGLKGDQHYTFGQSLFGCSYTGSYLGVGQLGPRSRKHDECWLLS